MRTIDLSILLLALLCILNSNVIYANADSGSDTSRLESELKLNNLKDNLD